MGNDPDSGTPQNRPTRSSSGKRPFPKGNKLGNKFQKGQSGNAGGRPKSNLLALLGKYGRAKRRGDTRPREEILAENIWDLALEGDEDCRRILIDKLIPKDLLVSVPPGSDLPPRFTLSLGHGDSA